MLPVNHPSTPSNSSFWSKCRQMLAHRTFRRPIILIAISLSLFILYSVLQTATSSSDVTTISVKSRIQLQNTLDEVLERYHLQGPILYNHIRGANDTSKMEFIRNMTRFAWNGYMKYAKGADELNAEGGRPHYWNPGQSQYHTSVDAMDTLYIMGMMKEYEEAKVAVLESMDFHTWKAKDISVFETNIRTLGGLLSAYDLEGDSRFLAKAVDLADLLLSSFDGNTNGIPLNSLNVTSKKATSSWGSTGQAYLAEYGTLQLEFQYLSDVTGNSTYQEKTLRLFDMLRQIKPRIPGLYPVQFDVGQNGYNGDWIGIGGMADSFYEYLLKIWLSTGESRFRFMFEESADAMIEHVLTFSPEWNITYLPELHQGRKNGMAHHLTCFAGGWFGLGALSKRTHKTGAYLDAAHKIIHGCYTLYGTLSESVGFEEISVGSSPHPPSSGGQEYLLRPELIESLVYMYRFTHDEIYREWGWKIAQAIEQHCKTRFGYTGLPRMSHMNQESFFFAETLKYLFLLFTDDNVLPFESYVFNTEAHPLSIRGYGRRSDPSKWIPIKPNYYETGANISNP